jgi:chorismate mutase
MWLGSRTIVNPFSVQEVAEALKGSDARVFIKNPVSPDLELWLGAFKRLEQQGIDKLAAIHRGFSLPNPGPYRNAPLWYLPQELKKHRPDIPLIGDPSHICGSRELLASVSQQALDLGYEGLMIESHISPDKALTDREQQVTPEELGELLKKLNLSTKIKGTPSLEALRSEIDRLDDELIAVLAQRMALSENIGKWKKALKMDILDKERWEKVLRDRLLKADLAGLDSDFLRSILEKIHEQSIKGQAKLMDD